MNGLAIEAEGLHKAYRSGGESTPVLTGVDLDVAHGEIVFLAGPSGCGKSTLLSILGCILSADEGSIRILGRDIMAFGRREQAEFRRHRIGFVFQRLHLIPGLKAWENVRVVLDLQKQPARKAKEESCRLLEAVGLSNKVSSHVSQLSMGQRQRVALARALAGNPDLILADEPTAALDAETGLAAMRLLRDLAKERGKTVFVVTHDSRIFHLADRILHLENGRITSVNASADLAAID